MKYTENYYRLCHGTDQESAQKIISEGFLLKGDTNSWCGKGVYFYDIKKKAWWWAKLTCERLKKEENRNVKAAVIFADIINISTDEIFDLRAKQDLERFEECVKPIFEECKAIAIPGVQNETERRILLRSMLISYYADISKTKLVIGNFRQRPQPLYEHVIEFADSLDMIFGIETIYCVKDISILSGIHIGGMKNEGDD